MTDLLIIKLSKTELLVVWLHKSLCSCLHGGCLHAVEAAQLPPEHSFHALHSDQRTARLPAQLSHEAWSSAWPCSQWESKSSVLCRTMCLSPTSCDMVPGFSWHEISQTHSCPLHNTVYLLQDWQYINDRSFCLGPHRQDSPVSTNTIYWQLTSYYRNSTQECQQTNK